MASDKSNKKVKKGSNKSYRIYIRNNETLQEVFSLKLNFRAMYFFLSTIVVLFFVIIWLLIAYTPLKRLMPGYDDVYIHPEYIKLSDKVNEVESAFKEQEFYIESFRNLLMGESIDSLTEDDMDLVDSEIAIDTTGINQSPFIEDHSAFDPDDLVIDQDKDFIKVKDNLMSEPTNNIFNQLYLIPPVNGVILAYFNPVKRHYGIDISAPNNSPVKAILDGHVISSDWTLETGNSVCILHDNNVISFYKHNAINLVKTGTYVKAGEAVAIIGNTGTKSTGPHLHFELWKNGKPVDPVAYINF